MKPCHFRVTLPKIGGQLRNGNGEKQKRLLELKQHQHFYGKISNLGEYGVTADRKERRWW